MPGVSDIQNHTPQSGEELQPERPEPITSGAIIGNYILFQCLGHTSRSTVFTCRHKDLEGPMMAIRVLNPSLSSDPTASARFHREVVASYTVNHPNVVRTHEFINDGVYVAYTMELMECGNLKQLLDSGELLDLEDIVVIAQQICSGLEAVHASGLIHRNLKPGNVFFSGEGEVKIADFGIARSESGPKLTNDGEVLGTVGYTSPEYLQTGVVDHRGDIYAVGLLLYEMITGAYPFYSPNPVESIRLRLTSDPVSPCELRPECPLELAALVLRAIARSPDDRFQAISDLRLELDFLRVAASKSSLNSEYRKRRQSFWKRIPESYVSLGVGHESEKASKIDSLVTSLGDEMAKRRFAFSLVLASLFGVLGMLIAFALFGTRQGSLAELEDRLNLNKGSLTTLPESPEITKSATLQAEEAGYVVQQGDTLSGISIKLGVSARELMQANNITDPNVLQVGASLKVPK